MKRFLLLHFLLSGAVLLHAQIPNASFENWKSASTSLPETWTAQGNISKTTGPGSSAIKLSNNSSTGDISYLSMVRVDTSAFYRPVFSYSGNPDSIVIVYKPSLGSDTAYFHFGFTKAGEDIPIKSADFFLTGNNGQWTTKTLPVAYTHPTSGLTADSGYALITSADEVFGPLSSGNIEIEDIRFKNTGGAAPNIPNGGFENWNNISATYPEGRASVGLFLMEQGLLQGTTSTRSQDHTDGSYGVELYSLLVKDPLTGETDTLGDAVITMANPNGSALNVDIYTPSFPVSARYKSFRGQLKTSFENNDIAIAWINFFDADSVVGSAIYRDGANHAFQEFSEDIAWDSSFSGIPDSATIMLAITDSTFTRLGGIHSYAVFDQLRLDNWNTSAGKKIKLQASVYPNPSRGESMLRASLVAGSSYRIAVMASDGREVWNTQGIAKSDKNFIALDLRNLSSGIYTLQLQSENTLHSEKIILSK